MRLTMTALTLALAAGAAMPVLAQSAAAPAAAAPAAAADLCPMNISNAARKSLIELQTAIGTKDRAAIAAKVAAARKTAKTKEDRCLLAQFELKAAADASDYVAASAAVEALAASGAATNASLAPLLLNIGKLRYQAKDFPGAAASFERASQLAPTLGEPVVLLAEARAKAGRVDEALVLFKKAAAIEAAAGRKVEESWLKRGVGIAYDAKSTQAFSLGRDWVAAYPTAKNWRDALRVYMSMTNLPEAELLDLHRLSRATRSLAGESDYARYAQAAMAKGFSGEAAAVLNEGIASNALSRSSVVVSALLKDATAKSSGDRAGLGAQAKAALAAATAKQAMATADAYLGYGDYAQAATLYRAALSKTGADLANANLRLGIALALSGDKAGARTALEAVVGPKAEIAQYWLTYNSLRA
jgi:lipopolysaccharide biosynthesis regulator YciM